MTRKENDINVRVLLRAGLKKYGGGEGERVVSLPEGAMLRDLIGKLKMRDEDVWVVGLNGILASGESRLENDDTVEFFEPVAGG